ncbi:MAG: two-component system, chemotaxis family, sensor histidine kinase and response regulator WspE [Desulfovibrionales bacterium]|nr:two-component system, chemotaxis family, sensor histidine kinase and response regulator WspE [Desulfovibrionales bacterium]
MDQYDPSMLELFRQEAEEASRILLAGLTPDAEERSEELPRAAHSIRGAARIVGLSDLAELARFMEECLQAGRPSGELRDNLVRAAKIFASIGQAEPDALPQLIESLKGKAEAATASLSGRAATQEKSPPKPAPEPKPSSPPASGAGPLIDATMLDLFRSEAQDNAAAISSGLVELEQHSASPERLESLMRAAHSIKGAARIVGLNQPVELAHAMEDVLTSSMKDPNALSGRVDQLLQGADLLAELARCKDAELTGGLETFSSRIQELVQALHGPPEGAAGQARAQQPSSAAPQSKTAPAPASEAASALESELDTSMLELFRVEAEGNAQVLSTGLVELEAAGASPERVEPLMRAAHSIKGAARIVGLANAVGLAHAMEDALSAAQHGERTLSSNDIDLLLKGTDVLAQLSKTPAEKLPALTVELAPRMEELGQAIRSGEAPAAQHLIAEYAVSEEKEPAEPTESAAPTQPPAAAPSVAETDGVVRISARNLSQLMALSGETLVETSRLTPFSESLLQIKNKQREMAGFLEAMQERLERDDFAGLGKILNQAAHGLSQCRRNLVEHIEDFDIFVRRSDNLHNRLHNHVLAGRMRPFGDGVHGFPRLIRDIAKSLNKKAVLKIKGKDTQVDRDILDRLEAPLNHILRNAVDHGLETPEERREAGKPELGVITLEARHSAGMLAVTVSDDGRGMDPERIRSKVIAKGMASEEMARQMNRAELMEFLFLPGFTTTDTVTEISGRGVGLDVVHTMIQEVGGNVRAESTPGKGMTFSMQMPLTLSVLRTLLVEVSGQPFALQLTRLDRILNLPFDEVRMVEDKQYFVLEGSNIGLVHAAQILELPMQQTETDFHRIVVISDRMNRYGLAVDRFLGERALVVTPVDSRLGKIQDVYAVARLWDGSPVFILDVEDLVRSVDGLIKGKRLAKLGLSKAERQSSAAKNILVVDDSLTVREVERKLLENAGFSVQTAVNGMDGLNTARLDSFDLIITDVDMPRMNGVELVRKIKADPELAATPIMIVSYKDRQEDRLAGLDAGADYYLTKGSFHDETLLQAVYDLIGEP